MFCSVRVLWEWQGLHRLLSGLGVEALGFKVSCQPFAGMTRAT